VSSQTAASAEDIMVVYYEEVRCEKIVCCCVSYALAFFIS